MANTEGAKKIIADISNHDLDQWVRTDSFSPQLEESVRGHIHQELTTFVFFRKLAADCARSNIALHGFARLWERSAAECLADFHWLEKYLVSRGGRSKPTAIEPPGVEWPADPVEPVEPCREALFVERRLLEDLQRLCSLAEKSGDAALCDTIHNHFMHKEVKHVKDLADMLQQVVRVSKQPGLGIYLMDQELRRTNGSIPWGSANDTHIENNSFSRITECQES
ncbi:Ferritin-like domain protein [Aspergillus sclerotialis]|uniref:Ferritin n=1 Tax=Aspergillus sclerotialis TaxID=2070753 RepID=A0A3A2ZBH5_9EURO|nr:Ferritin-like domain protein [Aspergillus sclerotialis]